MEEPIFWLHVVKSARGDTQAAEHGFDWVFLWVNVSFGRGGLVEVRVGGKWKLQLCSGAFFSPIFSEPYSSWKNLCPSAVKGRSNAGAGFGCLVCCWL